MIVSLENDLALAASLQSGRTYELPISETAYMRLAIDLSGYADEVEVEVNSDRNVLKVDYYSHYQTRNYYKLTTVSEGESDIEVKVLSNGEVLHTEILHFIVNA